MIRIFALALAVSLMGIEAEPLPAWVSQGVPPDGITVSGSAAGGAPATFAQLTLGVTARDHVTPLGPSDLAPLVDALVAAGAMRENVHLPAYLSDTSKSPLVQMTVDVPDPSIDAVERGVASITKFLLTTPTLWIATANVQVSSNDCARAEQQAAQTAVEQARANAQRLAQYAGVRIGAPVAVDGLYAGADPAACTRTYALFYPGGIMLPQAYLNIPLRSSVTMRFTIAQ